MNPREPRKLRASLDDSEILACPECDGAHVRAASPGKTRPSPGTERWYCNACGARFNIPTIRERHRDTRCASGLKKKLLGLDPGAVGSEADR